MQQSLLPRAESVNNIGGSDGCGVGPRWLVLMERCCKWWGLGCVCSVTKCMVVNLCRKTVRITVKCKMLWEFRLCTRYQGHVQCTDTTTLHINSFDKLRPLIATFVPKCLLGKDVTDSQSHPTPAEKSPEPPEAAASGNPLQTPPPLPAAFYHPAPNPKGQVVFNPTQNACETSHQMKSVCAT